MYSAEFPVYVYPDIDVIRSGGIECRGLKANPIARKKPLGDPVLEKYVFVPNINIQVKSPTGNFSKKYIYLSVFFIVAGFFFRIFL